VIRIAVWAIILFAVMALLGSNGDGAGPDFDTKDPGDFF
jgi:hypothetical protein